MLRVVTDESTREEATSTLDEICREGARRMLAAALEAEADAYIAELVGELDDSGRRLVTRNGHARPRTITTGSGAIEIRAPRVNDRRVDSDTGEKQRFRSSIVPPWARKSPKVAEVLPLLYLHGLSSGDFAPALSEFFGSQAGLSPSVITRLTTQWQAEHRAFMDRDLSERDYGAGCRCTANWSCESTAGERYCRLGALSTRQAPVNPRSTPNTSPKPSADGSVTSLGWCTASSTTRTPSTGT